MSHKVRIPITLITLTILALACGKLEIGFEPNNEVLFEANPAAALPEDQIPENCPLSDLNVYVNGTYSYCFGYPLNFTLKNDLPNMAEVHGPAIGSEIEPVFATFRVEVDPINEDQSLREQAEDFLNSFSVIDPNTFSWNEVEIGAEPGLVVEPIPVQLSWKIIFVRHHGNQFRLMYWPVDIPEAALDLGELFQVTTQTFEFTD